MPIPERLIAQFQPSSLFHVLCKSLDGQVLFKNDENKIFFLKKYAFFLSDFVNTLSYNLLNNHVHWLIRPKPSEEIKAYLTTLEPEILTPTQIKFLKEEIDFHELIEQQFNRFFISYSLSFNKMYVRKGHLFNRPFKRIEITDNSHFTQTIIYIHTNAQHHRIMKDFRDWRWSSYHSFISTLPTLLNRTEVLEWFGGKAEFIKTHIEMAGYFYDTPFE